MGALDEKRGGDRASPDERRFAAWLLGEEGAPCPVGAPAREDAAVSRMLSLLKRNKVPLAQIAAEKRRLQPEFFAHALVRERSDAEAATLAGLKGEWLEARALFLGAGIESMLIKSVGRFPYTSSNLDVLIRQEQRERAQAILKGMGYLQLHNVEEPYKTLFRRFVGGESVSVIHLHNKVAWINPFHDERLLWERWRRSPLEEAVDIPSPEDSILILSAHWFYEDKELTLADVRNIGLCLRAPGLDWEYLEGVATRRGWLAGLRYALLVQRDTELRLYGTCAVDEARATALARGLSPSLRRHLERRLAAGDPGLPVAFPRTFGKSLHFLKTARDRTTTLPQKVREIWRVAHAALFVVLFKKYRINIRHQEPMLVTFSGVDGSGKTTYAEIVVGMLDFCELRHRYVWSRVGSSGFLRPFSKAAAAAHRLLRGGGRAPGAGGATEESEGRRQELFGRSRTIRSLGLLLLLGEMAWRYTAKVRIPLWLNKVVVCDRYVHDTLADVAVRYRVDPASPEGRAFARLLTAVAPAPDLAFFVGVGVEEVARRRELTPAERALVVAQTDLYERAVRASGLREVRVGAGDTVRDVAGRILGDVLAGYYGKWPERPGEPRGR